MNNATSINAILFAHDKDIFEDTQTLSFFKKFKDLKFIDYSKLKPTSCKWANSDSNMDAGKGIISLNQDVLQNLLKKIITL